MLHNMAPSWLGNAGDCPGICNNQECFPFNCTKSKLPSLRRPSLRSSLPNIWSPAWLESSYSGSCCSATPNAESCIMRRLQTMGAGHSWLLKN